MAIDKRIKLEAVPDDENREPIEEVLSNYNLEILNITNESYKGKKGVWWVKTPDGDKILKKMSNSEATLKFIIAGVNYLIENGINIPYIMKTKNGEYYVKHGKSCFILSEAINGTKPTCDSYKELELVSRELGRFHRASIGFKAPYGSKPKNHLGTWINEYTEFLENMNKFYSLEKQKRQNTAMKTLMAKEFPYFYDRGKTAINGLKNEEYRQWVIKTNSRGSLCHQDFSSANLLLTEKGMYVLDTDSIAIDLPARDIRKLLNKIMKKSGEWDLEVVKKIMYWYNLENPLVESEWKVVMYDLLFPHLFLGAIDKYYYQRDKTWGEEDYLSRINQMASFEKTITPLIQNFDLIIPKSNIRR